MNEEKNIGRNDISILPLLSARAASTPSPQPLLIKREEQRDSLAKQTTLLNAKVSNDILLKIFHLVIAESPTEYRNIARVCKFVSSNKKLRHFAIGNHNLIAIQKNIGTRDVSPEFEAHINELFGAIADEPRPLQMALLAEVADQHHSEYPAYYGNHILEKAAEKFHRLYTDRIPALVRRSRYYARETETSHIIDYRAYLRLRAGEQLAVINIQELHNSLRQESFTIMPVDYTQLQRVQSGRKSYTHGSWADSMKVLGMCAAFFVLLLLGFFTDIFDRRSATITLVVGMGAGLLCCCVGCCCSLCADRSSNQHEAVRESSTIFHFRQLAEEKKQLLPAEPTNRYAFLSSTATQPLLSEVPNNNNETRIEIAELAGPEASSATEKSNFRI
jgi:hypothetical protein